MQQRLSMQLRYAGSGSQQLNLADSVPGLPGSKWTQGATLIDSIPINPPLQETWSVLAWTFTFAGGWDIAAGLGPSYGKLGQLWGGLLPGGVSPTANKVTPQFPWVNPMLPLPPDLTTFTKIWDGSTDPVFPAVIQSNPGVPTIVGGSAEQNLPSPLDIRSGSPLLFGLWLTPSLVSNTILEIGQAKLAIVYDDGQKEPQPL